MFERPIEFLKIETKSTFIINNIFAKKFIPTVFVVYSFLSAPGFSFQSMDSLLILLYANFSAN